MSKLMDFEAVTAAKIGGEIVTQTLDTLNSDQYGGSRKGGSGISRANGMSDAYNLSKSVLSAAYQAKGAVICAKG